MKPYIYYKYINLWDDEDIEFFEKLEDLMVVVRELGKEKEQNGKNKGN